MDERDTASAVAVPAAAPAPNASNLADTVVGSVYVALGVAFALFLAWAYWSLHGGSLESFALWSTGDKRWLEVLFWSLFTVHTWNTTDVAYEVGFRRFKKHYVLAYIARTFETPPVSLALVFVLVNLGVTFGEDAKISLEKAPIQVVIALAIISAFFSREAVDALQPVAQWFAAITRRRLRHEQRDAVDGATAQDSLTTGRSDPAQPASGTQVAASDADRMVGDMTQHA